MNILSSELLSNLDYYSNSFQKNVPYKHVWIESFFEEKKQILTKELKSQSEKIKKEIELRQIPDIEANIEFKKDEK